MWAFLRRRRRGRPLSVVAFWLRCRRLPSWAKSLWPSQCYGLPTPFDLSRSSTRRTGSWTSRTARNEWPLGVSFSPFRLLLPRFLSVRRPPHSMPNNVPANAPPREGLVRNVGEAVGCRPPESIRGALKGCRLWCQLWPVGRGCPAGSQKGAVLSAESRFLRNLPQGPLRSPAA